MTYEKRTDMTSTTQTLTTQTITKLVRRLRVEGGYLPNALVMSPEDFKEFLRDAGSDFRINPNPSQGNRGYLMSLPTVKVYVHSKCREGIRFYETEITSQTNVLDLLRDRPVIGLYKEDTLLYGELSDSCGDRNA